MAPRSPQAVAIAVSAAIAVTARVFEWIRQGAREISELFGEFIAASQCQPPLFHFEEIGFCGEINALFGAPLCVDGVLVANANLVAQFLKHRRDALGSGGSLSGP